MKGYRKVYNVWFVRNGEWFPVGVGKRPLDIAELDNARDVAFEASTRPEVPAVMVVKLETAQYSDLETRQQFSKTEYTVLV